MLRHTPGLLGGCENIILDLTTYAAHQVRSAYAINRSINDTPHFSKCLWKIKTRTRQEEGKWI